MTRDLAQAWLREDPDPDTRAELEALLAAPDSAAELDDRFGSTLEFGTAGLRGLLGAGPNRMNRLLVHKVSAGLGHYLADTLPKAKERGVVIGYDGRRKSRVFAEDAARVLLGLGFRVCLSENVSPTPLIAYALKDLGACAGVVVTASHNPPDYNGYKVYWDNGAQIIPPHDSGIAAAIARVGAIDSIALGDLAKVETIGEELTRRYLAEVAKLSVHPEIAAKTPLKVAYTAMHGVGAELVKRSLAQLGIEDVHSEPSQDQPDGEFPTVAFPNPEEEGAMDRVFALAQKISAEVVVANDPDADRLAVALPKDGGYTMLTGDQVGTLLADYLLREGPQDAPRLVASTLVSSQLLALMAKDAGVDYRVTLTGFKWIANAALEAKAASGARFVMGYEEALGYSIGELVRDKDGVSAVAIFCELAAFAKSQGQSVWDRLEAVYRRFGVFLTKQVSLVLPGATGKQAIDAHMAAFRKSPPKEIGGYAVESVHDLAKGAFDLPKSDVLVFQLEGNRRIIMRPSGTEPKLKSYYEVCAPVDASVDAARAAAEEMVERLAAAHQALLS